VSAAVEDGWVNLAVVNLCAERGWETEIKGVPEGREVQVYLVTGEGLGDVNTEEETSVEIKESTWVAEERFTFLKHSFTMLRWRL
jgi:alpha-N-arabinofuranosidase